MEFLNQLLYYPFQNIIAFFVWLAPGHNAIWGIVALTLIVRFVLLVPSKRAAQAQRKMMKLQPMLEELKAEYGDDKQGLAMAQMELYKKNDINPFSSCLPILIQFPILIILYEAILHGLSLENLHLYDWLPRPPFIDTNFLGLDLVRPDRFYVLPVLAALLQYVQVRMTMPQIPKEVGQQPDPAQMIQRQSMYFFPVVTLIAALSFPAGVVIYWVVSTIFSIVQQYFVNKENLRLKGVEQAIKEGERRHPENKAAFERVKKVVEKSDKNGVTVTVRRKG